MFKTIYKVALTSLIAISFLHSAQEAKANPFGDIFNNVGGRCGAVGEGRVKIYNVHRKTLFIRVERVRPGTGYYEQELKEGQSFESSICNRDGFRVFVYTSLDCGKNHIATSEFVRVYNYEQVNITKGGFVYQHKDQFTALSRGLEFFGMMMGIKYGLASSDLAKFGLRSSNVMKMCAESDTSTYTGKAKCIAAIAKYGTPEARRMLNLDGCLAKYIQPGTRLIEREEREARQGREERREKKGERRTINPTREREVTCSNCLTVEEYKEEVRKQREEELEQKRIEEEIENKKRERLIDDAFNTIDRLYNQ